jgi:outer membrane protein assembly factor BamB
MNSKQLLIGSHDGALYALDARRQACVWTTQLGSSVFASPALGMYVMCHGSRKVNNEE